MTQVAQVANQVASGLGTTLSSGAFGSGHSTSLGNHIQVIVEFFSDSTRAVTITDNKSGGSSTYTADAELTFVSGSTYFAGFNLFSCAAGITTFTATFDSAPSMGAGAIYVRESSGLSALQGSVWALNVSPGETAGAIVCGNIIPSSQPAWKKSLCFLATGDATGPDAVTGGQAKVWNFGAGATATPAEERITSTAETTANFTAVSGQGTKAYFGLLSIYTETGGGGSSIAAIANYYRRLRASNG